MTAPRRSSRRRLLTKGPYRIGLISDTHGLLRPELPAALAGVEEILHAGDVGTPEVLAELQALAPVTAVKGNVDVCVPALRIPSFSIRDLHGLSILITHYLGTPDEPLPPVAAVIKAERPRLILTGHTHQPRVQERDGTMFVNPGSCGPRRFELPVSYGLLTIHDPEEGQRRPRFEVRIFDLESGALLDGHEVAG